MSELAKKKCVPCEGGASPLEEGKIHQLLSELSDWNLQRGSAGPQIEKEYRFPDFQKALDFVNRLGAVAEAEGHHPDVYISWGKVRVSLSTHSIGGLSENDFILAAKADEVLAG